MKQAERRKFHYIYKITRTDGKYYIGLHSTDDLEDGYFGSGQLLWKSIKKHGKEKHSKEILEFHESRTAVKLRERELVDEECLKDPLCMNLRLGGEGGGILAEKNKTNGFHRKGFDAMMLKKDLSASAKKVWALHREKMLSVVGKNTTKMIEAASSKEAIEKKKNTFKERGHMQGEKNSQYGTCWVTNAQGSLKIKKEELDGYLERGFRRGRK
jgi:hypothetical protein